MAVRDDRGDVKQTTAGFRGPLMVQSLTSAKSKFLSLIGLIDLIVVADGGHSPCNPSSTTAFHSPHGLCYNFTVEELTASIWIGNLMSVG